MLHSEEETYPSRKPFLLSWIWISSSTTRRNADSWGIFGDEDVECVCLGNQVAARWALLALVCTIMNIFWVVHWDCREWWIWEKEKVSKGKGKSKGKPTPSGAPKPKKEKTQDQLARNVPRLSCCFLIMWRLFVTSCHYNVKRLFFWKFNSLGWAW